MKKTFEAKGAAAWVAILVAAVLGGCDGNAFTACAYACEKGGQIMVTVTTSTRTEPGRCVCGPKPGASR